MIKSKIKVFSGLLLLFFGLAVVFTSLAGMTGFAVSSNLSSGVSAAIGIIPIVAGLIILFFGRGGDDSLEGMVYERLLKRNAYGHHTEPVEDLSKTLGRRGTTPKEVEEAIANAVRSGALTYSGGKSSVSINMSKSALSNALRNYDLDSTLKDRIQQLIERGGASGVR